MCHRIYLSSTGNPYENLAAEEYFCRSCTEGVTLFLWQNRDTVVIGKNQNSLRECDLAALRRDGVFLARRSTGGGAVFHDDGNLNFSLVFPSAELDKEPGYDLVQRALESLGISVERSGRNDLRVDNGKKVSGNAFRYSGGVTLHHGTLLVQSRTERMSDYLKPSFEKLQAHGVESVRARVTNLSCLKNLDVEDVKAALIRSFCAIYGETEAVEFTGCGETEEIARHLASDEWLYGRDPAADVSLQRRFEWGSIELSLSIEKGAVKSLKVYTDALDPFLPEKLEKILLGCRFSPIAFSEAIAASDTEGREDLSAWLKSLSF